MVEVLGTVCSTIDEWSGRGIKATPVSLKFSLKATPSPGYNFFTISGQN